MKKLFILIPFLILIACGKSGEHTSHDTDGDDKEDNPNRALYDQVMSIHDEVMPKMDDLMKLKMQLQDRITQTAGMAEDTKKSLEETIMSLDSADKAMMDWMHNFNPPADSADEETVREYLETEMERIKKVRDLTNETIEKAKTVAEKQ